MPLDPAALKVVAPCGVQHSQVVCAGNKAQVTVVAYCNAAGYTMPPMLIFDRKTLKPEMGTGEVPGTMYGLSSSGWVDGDLFELWFTHHFLPYAPPTRPLLLLLDGHSSHYLPNVVKKAAEEQVILFCLPPHTTHLTQPLDKGPFGPLKMYWQEECQKLSSGGAPTPAGTSVFTKHNWDMGMGYLWFNGWGIYHLMGGAFMAYWVGHL